MTGALRCPQAVRIALACVLTCVAAAILSSGSALATEAHGGKLIAALDGKRGVPSKAARRSLANLGLRLGKPVFRGHEDWNIWEVNVLRGAGRATIDQLEKAPGVRWAELDANLSYDSTDTTLPGLESDPFGTFSGPDLSTPTQEPPSSQTLGTTSLAASPCITPSSSCAPPPTGCTPGSSAGLDAGQANDPLFCNEPVGPYYAEEWNNFCFLPQTQAVSAMGGAAAAPNTSGTCNTGAWQLGAQGQGTVIAILDSGVNYNHQDLSAQMVNTTNDPLLADPNFPGAIHGWNFYDDNPDPMDYFGHGTGRAGLAAARADNGVGMAGASPKSLLLAVKVGDTYVVHSENLAQGAVYAADHGADVINTSLGATGNSRLLRAAATYAYSKGVFWAGATANEYSTHHNYPTNLDTVAGAGGLGPNLAEQQSQTCQSVGSGGATNCAPVADPQTTFLQKVNYANYAGIQTFATPIDTVGTGLGNTSYGLHQSGTSTATPHLAAAGAIVRSAGFRAGLCGGHADINGELTALGCNPNTAPAALSSNEVRQLLAYTATRVHNDDASGGTNNYPPNASGDPTRAGGEYYPEQKGDAHLGWNIWAGFGRPDIYAAAAYAEQGLIPPEAQLFGDQPPPGAAYNGLKGPIPFSIYDPAKTPTVDIVGHTAAPRLGSGQTFNWKVQVAPCMEPTEADFTDVPGGSGTSAQDGVLATWTLPTSTSATCTHQSSAEHPFSPAGTYTIRVLSTVNKGGGGFVNPTWTGPGGSDTDQDPNASLPQKAPLYGQDRRVVYIRPSTAADHGSSPYYLGASGEGSPTLYDIEGRGELDSIVPTSDGKVLALRPDGTNVPGWPVAAETLSAPHNAPVNGTTPTGQIVGSVAVGDIDGDKQPEVVAASFKGGLYAWHRDGTRVSGFPVQVPPVSQYGISSPFNDKCLDKHPADSTNRYSDYGSISAPVLANVENRTDGKLDIVQAGANQCIYVVGPNGTVLGDVYANDPTTNANSRPAKIADTPAVGDINNDGHLDIVVGTEEIQGSIPTTSGRMYAFDGYTLATTGTASPLTGWPVVLHSASASGVPAVATGVISSPALFPSSANDGTLQTATGVFLAGSDPSNPAFTINANGTQGTILHTDTAGAGSNFTDSPFLWAVAQTAVGSVGAISNAIVTGGLSTQIATDTAGPPGKKPGFQHAVGAYDPATGAAVPTFPRQIEDWQFLSGPAIADVKGDGTHQVIEGSGGGYLHAFDPAAVGTPTANLSTSLSRYLDLPEPSGFPVFEGGGYITSTPTVGQLSRSQNGKVAVANVTRDGYLFLTDTQGQASANDQWWHFHHDERNTGLVGVDSRPPATVDNLSVTAGPGAGAATVHWTEVGDDWWTGQIPNGKVDLRWSTAPITDSNFSAAVPAGPATTQPSGSSENVTVTGLPSHQTIYFAERATDDSGNTSLIARTQLIDYPRPGFGASPLRVPLVPAFNPCSSANSTHGAPLNFPSCSQPVPASSTAMFGSKSIGFATYLVCNVGATAANCGTTGVVKPDLRIFANLRDVRCRTTGTPSGCTADGDYNPNGAGPYTTGCTSAVNCGDGTVLASPYCAQSGTSSSDCIAGTDLTLTGRFAGGAAGKGVRITDTHNGVSGDLPGTTVDGSFPIPMDCLPSPTNSTIGSTCAVNTSANALMPGVVRTGDAAIWEFGETQVLDAGPNGVRGDSDDQPLAVQGIFLP